MSLRRSWSRSAGDAGVIARPSREHLLLRLRRSGRRRPGRAGWPDRPRHGSGRRATVASARAALGSRRCASTVASSRWAAPAGARSRRRTVSSAAVAGEPEGGDVVVPPGDVDVEVACRAGLLAEPAERLAVRVAHVVGQHALRLGQHRAGAAHRDAQLVEELHVDVVDGARPVGLDRVGQVGEHAPVARRGRARRPRGGPSGELDRPSQRSVRDAGHHRERGRRPRRPCPRDRSRVVTCSRSSSWPATPVHLEEPARHGARRRPARRRGARRRR